MSMSTEVAAIGDEKIQEYPPRERSGYVDFRMDKVSVCYMGKGRYRCGTCEFPDNYTTPEKEKCCAHISRVIQYREDHHT